MWKKILMISLIFAVSVVILITLSLYSFQRFNAFIKYSDAIDEHQVLLNSLHKLRVDLISLEDQQRAFLLFSDSSFLTSYENLEKQIMQSFSRVYELTKNNVDQQKRLQSLNVLIKSRMDFLTSGIIMGYPPADYRLEGSYMQKCLRVLDEMEASQDELIVSQRQTKEFYQTSTPQNFKTVFVLTMTVFAISFGLLLQQYHDRLRYQGKLEKNIVELNQANEEWEQIAYAASHDLQEPLRKIRTFSGILQSRHIDQLDAEGQTLVQRMDLASARAQSLMMDIVNYNMIVYPRENLAPVDLKDVRNQVIESFDERIKTKKASIFADDLPLVRAYPTQITVLLSCLIDNSLKFSKTDEPNRITISSSIVNQKTLPVQQNLSFSHYHKIVVEDNGIGFENQFSDKMFKMFQRLHNQEAGYEGRGIGLAIVKRIMTNHLGLVVAHGRPGKGAKFTLYFPVR
jgi:signal transduction histidine kinase